MSKWITLEKKKNVPGSVRYKAHPTRMYDGRPDLNYEIRYSINGKGHDKKLGWTSKGMTPEKCYEMLTRIHLFGDSVLDSVGITDAMSSTYNWNAANLNIGLKYAQMDWHLFPCTWNRKEKRHQPLVAWSKEASSDPERIKAWAKRWKNCYFCVALDQSGISVVDVDVKNGKNGGDTWKRLCRENNISNETLTSRTPGNGWHFYYKGKTPQTTEKLGPGVDTPSMVPLPGSHVHGKGDYQLVNDQPLALLPECLQEKLGEPRKKAEALIAPGVTLDLPLNIERAVAYATEAEPAVEGDSGDKHTYNVACGVFDHGVSKDTCLDIMLENFNDRCSPPWEPDELEKKVQSAWNSRLNPVGCATPEADFASAPETAAVVEITTEEWPAPIDFRTRTAPPLPEEVMTPVLQKYCREVSTALQVPFGMCVMGALGVLAAVTQKKFKVMIRKDYYEPVNLYLAAALPSGEKKSPALAMFKRTLMDWQNEQAEKMRPEIEAAVSERATMTRVIEKLRTQAGNKDANLEEVQARIRELETALPAVPESPRLFADDATAEAIVAVMAKQNGCISIMEPEGGLFQLICGLYHDRTPNYNVWLKSHDGEDIVVDRKSVLDPVMLRDPHLTLTLFPQPGVLNDFAANKRLLDNGLLARFLFLLPNSDIGYRDQEPPPVSESEKKAYQRLMYCLANIPMENDFIECPRIINLSGEAYRSWIDFSSHIEILLRNRDHTSVFTAWANKLAGRVARIAGLYHIAETVGKDSASIDRETMERAITLGKIFIEHARIFFDQIHDDLQTVGATRILEWIEETRPEVFSAREVHRAIRGDRRFRKIEPVKLGLEFLMQEDFIRPEIETPKAKNNDRRRRGGQRPSPRYRVYPAL